MTEKQETLRKPVAAPRGWAAWGALLFGPPLAAWLLFRVFPAPDLDAATRADRERRLAATRAAERQALETNGIGIRAAMRLMAREWRDPAAGRARLLTRLARVEARRAKPAGAGDPKRP
ncbi:MAG: hypothetical protein J7M29_06250 [Verrucomicrobia bacterium]|nr:hypothetical protein [Verrucomicrobiota bacterium]